VVWVLERGGCFSSCDGLGDGGMGGLVSVCTVCEVMIMEMLES